MYRRQPTASNPRRSLPFWYSRGYLPHFATNVTAQIVTYRLADSLARATVAFLLRDRERLRNEVAFRKKIETYMDAGYGACHLRCPEIAAIVRDSFNYFDGERYVLHAYVIMPNHVHVLVDVRAPYELSAIVRRWKSGTARSINRHLGRKGPLWKSDYWDRYIRDDAHYMDAVEYILQNPVKAGLVKEPTAWPGTWVRDELH
ncbi:MAG: REP-associated tyrosine transposase [Planctomycetota bacterium]